MQTLGVTHGMQTNPHTRIMMVEIQIWARRMSIVQGQLILIDFTAKVNITLNLEELVSYLMLDELSGMCVRLQLLFRIQSLIMCSLSTTTPGENCEERGNVLILQEFQPSNDNTEWDDAGGGGFFYFDFDQPVDFDNIGIMDIDAKEGRNKITLEMIDGSKSEYWYEALGGDTYQVVNTKNRNVKRVRVDLPGNSAALSDLTFCLPVCK